VVEREESPRTAVRGLSSSSPGSAFLSCSTSFATLAGILCFDFLPKRFMRNAAPFAESLPSGFQDRLQLSRVAHEQTLQIVLILGPEQYGDRFAFAGHNDRALLGGFHVRSKIGGDLV
jgi:hypothetical protein